jgi:hypothetical protein
MALTPEQQALDYNPELQDVSRQRKLAELLMAQGMQQPQGQMISGYYVAPSFTQQLNPMANILAGQAIGGRADTKQAELAAALRTQGDAAVQKVMTTFEQNPQAGVLEASKLQQYPQVKALLPQLTKVGLPEATTEERLYKAAVADGSWNPAKMGGLNAFKNQMTEADKERIAIAKREADLSAARFNFEKSKTEINPAEAGLRGSFFTQAQPHIATSQAYRKIASAPETAAGDLSLIYGYMKILDPGSAVKEGEYATAENARGVPETVKAQYNKTINGQRLAARQRTEFVQSAGDLVKSQQEQFETQKKYYTDVSNQYRINPANIIYDPYADLDIKTTPPKAPKTTINAGQQLNIPQAGGGNGWNIISVTPSR